MSRFPQVLILAGGIATRLGDLATNKPKAMIEVAGKPFIEHQLRLLAREGVSDVLLCTSHLSEQIEDFVKDGSQFGLSIKYSRDNASSEAGGSPALPGNYSSDLDVVGAGHAPPVPQKRLGTGGAILNALPQASDPFAVLYGDTYLDIAYKPVFDAFLSSNKPAIMTVLRNENRWDRSNVVFGNGLIEIYDKVNHLPEMQHIDYGLSIFRKEAFKVFSPEKAFDLADVLKQLVSAKQLAGYEVTQRFYEIGTPDGLAQTEAYLHSK